MFVLLFFFLYLAEYLFEYIYTLCHNMMFARFTLIPIILLLLFLIVKEDYGAIYIFISM